MYGGQSQEKAGEIATEVLRNARDHVKEGTKIVEIADWVENEILTLGGQPAFPCSVAVNEFAAHNVPLYGDESIIPKNAIVKIDLGVHIDGYICDCATTINFNDRLRNLELASLNALKAACETIKDGITISELGSVIHSAIESQHAVPIYNLSGHTLGQYVVHSGISIHNVRNTSNVQLKEGMVVAIEPFATDGKGYVKDKGAVGVYSIKQFRNVRNPTARKIISKISAERKTLPFAERWLHKIEPSQFMLSRAFREMLEFDLLTSYPPLAEASGGMVSQHECTVLVEKNGCHIIGGMV
ncbi:MAG: type II methionyl aminopeptidase [Candidatus Micrarchaeia archaeon]